MIEKSCFSCINHFRKQTGPNEWTHDCYLCQRAFPQAEHCNLYQPGPRQPEQDEGLGLYVWDSEYEGAP